MSTQKYDFKIGDQVLIKQPISRTVPPRRRSLNTDDYLTDLEATIVDETTISVLSSSYCTKIYTVELKNDSEKRKIQFPANVIEINRGIIRNDKINQIIN